MTKHELHNALYDLTVGLTLTIGGDEAEVEVDAIAKMDWLEILDMENAA